MSTTDTEPASAPNSAFNPTAPDIAGAATEQPPERAPGLELLGELPGSGYRDAPALVRRADGQTVQLTPLLYAALEVIDGRRLLPEIAEALSEKIGKLASPEDVRYLIDAKLRPLGVLAHPDGRQPTLQKANPLLALRFKLIISDPKLTRRITGPFARLFTPLIVIALLLGFLATTWWVLFDKGLASATHQAFYQPGLLLAVFALTLLSAGFHEFGHAAACRRAGATPGAMGFGLYIVWPAFYTEVSDSYRLGRRKRLCVDLGGLYFNAVFAVAIFGLWVVSRWDALLLVLGAQLLQMLRQLQPLIRADGYHILADLIGVPDLFSHIKTTLVSLWPTRWRHRDATSLKPWARGVVILWVALVVPTLAFTALMAVVLLPRVVATAGGSLAHQWQLLGADWSDVNVPRILLRLLSMVAVALPVLGSVLLVVRLGRRTVTRAWSATADRPKLRAGAVLAGVLVLALLAFAWWPRDQYQPVRANERGAIGDAVSAVRPMLGLSPASRAASAPTGPLQAAGAQSALLLVPRDSAGSQRPALVLVRPPDGADPQVLAVPRNGQPQPGSPDVSGFHGAWPFPFSPPPPTGAGDNRAITINTKDGSAVYDIAFAMVWVTDGNPVQQRNEAYAVADCTGCKTVSVAFQAVFMLGQHNIVTPVNTAVAANYNCRECATQAIAVQLVASLNALPDRAVSEQLAAIWKQLDALRADIPHLTSAEIYARLKAVEADILDTLTRAAPALAEPAGSSVGTPDPSSSTTAAPDATESRDQRATSPDSVDPTATSTAGSRSGTTEQDSSTGGATATPSPAATGGSRDTSEPSQQPAAGEGASSP